MNSFYKAGMWPLNKENILDYARSKSAAEPVVFLDAMKMTELYK